MKQLQELVAKIKEKLQTRSLPSSPQSSAPLASIAIDPIAKSCNPDMFKAILQEAKTKWASLSEASEGLVRGKAAALAQEEDDEDDKDGIYMTQPELLALVNAKKKQVEQVAANRGYSRGIHTAPSC